MASKKNIPTDLIRINFAAELKKFSADDWTLGVRELKGICEKHGFLALPDFKDTKKWEEIFKAMSSYDVEFLGKAMIGQKEWNDKWRPIPITKEMWPELGAQLVELLGLFNPKTRQWDKTPTTNHMEEVEMSEEATTNTNTVKKSTTKKKTSKKKTAKKKTTVKDKAGTKKSRVKAAAKKKLGTKKTSTAVASKKKTSKKKTLTGTRSSFDESAKITIKKKDHGFRESSSRFAIFKCIKSGMTVKAFIAAVDKTEFAGAGNRELKRFVKKGLVTVK